ncbi:MAG: MBL fold metallo-hydrolase [Thalassospira sp.]|uniref:MBL fold metallo-hydrolase n=1 Tax=Thalassospira sp. TaxID=1912094 RepID=UPI003A89D99D
MKTDRRNFLLSGSAVMAATATGMLVNSSTSAAATTGNASQTVDISWLGGATMLIDFDGHRILTDPTFGEGEQAYFMADPNEMFDLAKGPNARDHARTTPFPGLDLSSVDLMIISHMHEDHFDQLAEKSLPKSLRTIVPTNDAENLAGKGFQNQMIMDWGQSTTITTKNGQITVTVIPAHHSPNPQVNAMLGKGNGYWLTFETGDWRKDIYWTGDTFPTDEVMAAVKTHGIPDILIPHMGAVGTTGPLGQISMGAEQVLQMADTLGQPNILPIHHSTYPLYLEPVSRLIEQTDFAQTRIDLIAEGSTIAYS